MARRDRGDGPGPRRDHGHVEVYDLPSERIRFFEAGGEMAAGSEEDYAAYYRFQCPRLARLRTSRAGEIVYDYAHSTEREMDRSEFYSDFLATLDLRYYVGGVLFRDERGTGIVGLQRTAGAGHVGEAEIRTMRALLPHIRHAVIVSERLADARRDADDLRSALDVLDLGMIVVDGRGRVQLANVRARELFASGALVLRDGVLDTGHRGSRSALGELLTAVLSSPPDLKAGRRSVALRDPTTGATLGVTAVRLPRQSERAASIVDDGGRALLLITAPRSPRSGDEIEGLLGVTPAEADLAMALASGVTLAEHAARRGVSVHTVRTHLARLKDKLGVRTQAQTAGRIRDLVPDLRPLRRHPNE